MPELTPEQLAQFHDEGYVVVDNVLDEGALDTLRATLDHLEARDTDHESISRGGGHIVTIHGLPLQQGPLSRVLQYRPVVELLERLSAAPIQITGGVLLDKHPEHNWDIGWHPDNGIYVHTIPEGAPQDIRARNVSCRLALDPAGIDSGGLHNHGRAGDAKERFAAEKGVLAAQSPGSALCFRPLLLHRTEKMTAPGRRRILHLPGTETYHWPLPRPLVAVDDLN